MGENSPPPGWYETSDGRTRWWDGDAWTDHHQVPVRSLTPQDSNTSKSPGKVGHFFSSVPGAILVIVGSLLTVAAIVFLLMRDMTCLNNTDCGIFEQNYWDAFGVGAIALIAGVVLSVLGTILIRRSPKRPHGSGIDSTAFRSNSRVALMAALCAAIGVAGTVAVLYGTDNLGNEPESASSTTDTEEAEVVETVPVEYGPDDFEVDLSVKEKQCYGTAGCNLTLRINPEFVGSETSDETWEVTFKITGDESGPVLQTFTMDATQITFQEEVSISTPSASTKPRAKITDVVQAF